MTPNTLKTILNTAPLIIQGTSKLVQIIKDRDKKSNSPQDAPVTIDSLNREIAKLERRLEANDKSDVEQIRLIEQLAKQNEILAETLNKTYTRLNFISFIVVLAIIVAICAMIIAL